VVLLIGVLGYFFYSIFDSFPLKIAAGYLGQTLMICGIGILFASIFSYKKFWEKPNGLFNKRNFWIILITSIVMIIVPIILWLLDIIWLYDLYKLTHPWESFE
jgi:hypothetical protein